MADNNEVIFKGKVVRQTYSNGDYRIYALDVSKENYPDIKHTKYGTVSIVGEMHELAQEIEYEVMATEENTKYGYSYRVRNIRRDRPTTEYDMYLFLQEILTLRQAEELYKHYPNIVEKVINNDLADIDLDKLHGIKQYTFNVIKNKIIENFALADLVIKFQGYLSISMLKKLYDKYTSVHMIEKNLREDPYKCLCGLARVGFSTADATLLELEEKKIIRFEEPLRESPKRCLSCMLYLLEKNEEDGHTYMKIQELRNQLIRLTPACSDNFIECMKHESIYYDKDKMIVALKSTYETEKYIADSIIDGLAKNNVWNYDASKYKTVDGCELSDEQIKTLDSVNKNTITILNGSAGCVDCDTEYFNGIKWKPISEFVNGDKVLQYNEDGTAELVYPIAYIKNKSDYLWHFKTKNGLNQCLSDNHMCYYETRYGVKKKEPFYKIKEKQETNGFEGKFITSFKYNKGTGIDLSEDEMRLMIAVFADGCYINNIENNYVKINVKKERKVNRLIYLLEKLNKKYKIHESKDGYTIVYFKVPFYAKHFPKEWYNCSYEQLKVIADEVMYWDGTFSSRERYTTSNKDDADFIQFVFSSVGYKAIIEISDRRGEKKIINDKEYIRKSILYCVTRTTKNKISMCTETRKTKNFGKTKIEKYKTKDGYEYCFNVPSHMLILRRENRIFVTGNCGKSMSVKGVVNMLEDNNKSYTLLAPTGKSSKVLSNFAGKEATTIHRGLGYIPPFIWSYNQEYKMMCDVLIIDEFSMVDIQLFKHVIDALDFNTTKLLIIGDNAQLPSVACGNLLHDFMECNIIPTVTLTKVFRYSSGGLMKVATDARMSKPYLTNIKQQFTLFGDNKDYGFLNVDDKSIVNNVIALYKKLLDQGISVEDIQVLTSYKKGEYGTIALNNEIQKIANKSYGCEYYMKVGDVVYYKDDLVMQTVNNYKARIYYDLDTQIKFGDNIDQLPEVTFVANGETGIIKEIDNNHAIIDFDGILVKYERNDMQMCSLSYAVTIHKSQGSSIKNVIVVTPKAHTYMLNSNIIYVGLTRMKEKCYHIGNVDTVNMCVKKKANLSRNTLMTSLLKSQ